MPANDTRAERPGTVPEPDLVGCFAARILERNKGLDGRTAEHAAEAYLLLQDHLAGCVSNLGAGVSGARWRDISTAEQPWTLEKLQHVAEQPYAQAKRAIRALIAHLQRFVEPPAIAGGSLPQRAAALVLAAAEMNAAVIEATKDGRLDEAERRELRRAAAELHQQADAIDCVANREE